MNTLQQHIDVARSLCRNGTLREVRIVMAADILAYVAHRGVTDKCGVPYIEHPRAVARMVAEKLGHDGIAAALLHDVVEDTPIPLSFVYSVFGSFVGEVVRALTRETGERYFDYIKRIVEDGPRDALIIKIADIEHNSLPERQTPAIAGMLKTRYPKALKLLKEAL